MKLVQYLTVVIGVIALISSCSMTPKNQVSGKIEGAEGLTVFLDKMEFEVRQSMDKVQAGDDGSFSFELEENLDPGIYNVRIGRQKAAFIHEGGLANIAITGQLNDLSKRKYQVSGSPKTQELIDAYNAINQDFTMTDYKETSSNISDGLAAMEFTNSLLGFRPAAKEMHDDAFTKVKNQYPESAYVNAYKKRIDALNTQIAKQRLAERIKVGQPAPEIEMPSIDGQTMRLSDLEGQVVLLDFWASWCRPCRRANPHVVETYKKYNDKGFTVFSVSLDGPDLRRYKSATEEQINAMKKRGKDRWAKAIEQDGLEWDYHVSHLQKWNCPAARNYGVSGIPKTFLIDREGKIAAINPTRTGNLEAEIQKLL